ncbi:MAG: acetyltransferase [Actinobacteria bacterium]|nr:acetyltransferase [Actinomycetota bacterium]
MPEQVVVVGASGFGRESLDVLDALVRDGAPIEIRGVVDDNPHPDDRARLEARGVAYLGTIEAGLLAAGSLSYVLGIGSPTVRRRLVERCDAAGLTAYTAVHPSAAIGTQPAIAPGSVVCARAVVSTNVTLGRHTHINPNATIGHDSVLEDFVSMNPGAVVSGAVTIGTGTLVGASATILQNLVIGSGVTVGAGAVVTRDVPDGVIVKGVPGRW